MTRVLYFASEYPRATDTFIQREISSLRDNGVDVESSAAHRPGDEHMVGEEQRSERERTFYLLPPSMASVTRAHLGLLRRSPRRYVSALGLAARSARPGIRGAVYQMFYFAEAGLLAARLRQGRFDHLHSHFGDVSTSIAMIAAELAAVPFSFTLHGPGVFFEAQTWRLDTKIERAAFVSCISWFARSQAQLLGGQEHADKLHIIHCGVDPTRYVDRSIAPEDEGDDAVASAFRLAFVARTDHVKGLSLLIEALAVLRPELPGIHLEVAGDGPDRARFETLASKIGVSDLVTFRGYISQSEVAEMLARTDAYVLPSFAEGVPVGLMEAQASGLPVVATQVGGVSELVIDGETGFVCRPGDVEHLIAALRLLGADPDLRRRLGAGGRARVTAEFNSFTEGNRLAQLFRAVSGSTSELGVRPDPSATTDHGRVSG